MTTTNLEQRAADGLAALGNVTRLRLFRLLIRAGRDGLNMGEMQRLMEIPGSTLNHHVNALVQAGLVEQEKRGREVICTAAFAAMDALVNFLTENCCQGVAVRVGEDAA
jgi:ArsR family transcriptional regulator